MAFKLDLTVDFMHAEYVLMHVSMTLTVIVSQWIGRGKQCLSYGIQTAHNGRLMHDIYAHVCFDALDLVFDFENICKANPTCCML